MIRAFLTSLFLASLTCATSCTTKSKRAKSPQADTLSPEEHLPAPQGTDPHANSPEPSHPLTLPKPHLTESTTAPSPHQPNPNPAPVGDATPPKKSWLRHLFTNRKNPNVDETLHLHAPPPLTTPPDQLTSANRPLLPSPPKPIVKPPSETASRTTEPEMPQPVLDLPTISPPEQPSNWRPAPNSPDTAVSSLAATIPPAPTQPNFTEPKIQPRPLAANRIATGTNVNGKPEFIRSPYGKNGLIKRTDIAPGSLIKCPYTGNWMKVP